jgi:hypothetical protein
LLNGVATEVDVLELDGRGSVSEPCVAYYDGGEAVHTEYGADACENEWRDEM